MYNLLTESYPVQPVGPSNHVAFAIISTVLLGTGSAYGMDRAEVWRYHLQPRVALVFARTDTSGDAATRLDVRTPAEHIENIRAVLNPSVADLAHLFDISRQAIYKWLSSESTPEPAKLKKIATLSHIADAFRNASISRTGAMLKMQTFNGRSLMDLLKSGEDCAGSVATLIAEAKAMEASYDRSGIASSKARPTNDWQSSISIPGTPEII